MKLNYHADTDSLYIELCDRPSVDHREISEGVVLDYDADGRLVGIDVDNAGNKIELQKVLLSKLPGKPESLRLDPCDDLLGFFHQHVEFWAAPDVEPPEPFEELP